MRDPGNEVATPTVYSVGVIVVTVGIVRSADHTVLFSTCRIMETSSFLIVGLLALYMMPTALTLECYDCTDIPGYSGVGKCNDENIRSITCDTFLDRCMTIKGTMAVPNAGSLDFQLKNCSSSIVCSPDSPYNSK
ncbi:uncharacterized protein LOC110044777 [Orbicella faveolata]|uniref:uncharacterized protein LOC110044777 n=1 Tax=Orbicella faveolata TaxID=48498 RepID=UPI0009E3FE38|nr:uncharacterized protein LOC110044777 [Orbicella faveolata]